MAVLLGSQIATWCATLAMLIIVPRYLGDAQFGRLSFATAFVAFFGLLAGLGCGTFIIKEVARDASRLGPYVFNALVMNALLVVLLSAAALASARVLGYPAQTTLIVGIACIGMALSTLNSLLVAGLQGEQRMGKAAALAVAQQYAANATVVAVVAARKGVVAVALASSWSALIALAGNGAQLFGRLRAGARLDLHLWKVLALGGLPFLLWNGVLMIYGSIDTPMLSMMAGDATVGWYTLAYKLIGVPAFLAPTVVTAFFPSLSEHGAGASPLFAGLANRALRLIFFLTAPMAAGIALVAGDVISVLHYPAGFTHAVPLIRILALHIPVVGIDMVLGATLMATDRQKQWVVVGCLAAFLNPLLNLWAIPATLRAFGNGAVGAAIITVATELFMMGGAIYLRPSGILDRQTVGFLLRCALACLPVLAVVVVPGGAWLPVKVALGAALYGLASLLLRTVSVREVQRTRVEIVNLVRPRAASRTA
jgi:O-antigen/teichoic acid export membrane protein